MKKFIAVFAIVAVVTLMAGSASAATVGKISDESRVNLSTKLLVTLFNRFFHNSTIRNDSVDSSSNSGGNTLDGKDDSGDWSIQTGDVTSAGLVENTANATEVTGDLETPDGSDITVTEVSDESTVNASTDEDLDDDELIENNQDVTNVQSASTNTGDNTGVSGDELYRASIKTGMGDSAVGTSNVFNMIAKMWTRRVR